MFVLVDDEAGVCICISLHQLGHAILNGIDIMLVVFDNHDDLRCESASERGVCDQHDGRSIDDYQVERLFQFAY